jgi:hypothetical protein
MPVASGRGIVRGCLILAIVWLLPALRLQCLERAAIIAGASLLEGALLGTAMAMITRTRKPLAIYFWLLICLLSLGPLCASWPAGSPWEIHPWPGAPRLVYFYFDMLRMVFFLLGIPYPFVRWGYHAPDPLPVPDVPAAPTETPPTS